jgi:hypothetical protein
MRSTKPSSRKAIYSDFSKTVCKLARGKLACRCGNAEFCRFFFTGVLPTSILAGCNDCGRVHLYVEGKWVEQTGPTPTQFAHDMDPICPEPRQKTQVM